MSQNPPATLSVKRKRTETPVDALIFEHTIKRQKSQILDPLPKATPGSRFYFKRLTKPNDAPQQQLEPPTPTTERRFHLEPTGRLKKKPVFVESRASPQVQNGTASGTSQLSLNEPTPASTPRPRKRPGASSALKTTTKSATSQTPTSTQPDENDVRALEAFSQQISKDEQPHITSPSKHKPHPPAQRFAQRHPEKAAQLAAEDPNNADAMDIDTDEYVYDTYIREPLPPTVDGQVANPDTLGTVGFLVIAEEDEDWWAGSDSDDKEFDTDDEDENAEDYYANDYPEDELSEDDEFGRDVYQKKYRHGSDDEEFDLENDDEDDAVIGSGEDEDDLHYKMTVPKAKRTGYWGKVGE